jgi:hypothetical protein
MNSLITQSKQIPAIGLAAALLALGLLTACKPKVEPVACTPLPIVDGFETAMTEGDKMRLRVPKHTSWLTADCQQIKGVELRYYWHKGELVWNDGTQSTLEFSKQTLEHPVIIYLTHFQFLHEAQNIAKNDTSIFAFKPWRLEGAVRHYKYPLEFYPKYYWARPDQTPAKAPPDGRWGVLGTSNSFTNTPFSTACDIKRNADEPQPSLVKGEFAKDYSDAKCRGGIYAVKGGKVASGMIDVWANNAHDIDKIYNAVIEKIQTYIEE